jgi:hypothetical protein
MIAALANRQLAGRKVISFVALDETGATVRLTSRTVLSAREPWGVSIPEATNRRIL